MEFQTRIIVFLMLKIRPVQLNDLLLYKLRLRSYLKLIDLEVVYVLFFMLPAVRFYSVIVVRMDPFGDVALRSSANHFASLA